MTKLQSVAAVLGTIVLIAILWMPGRAQPPASFAFGIAGDFTAGDKFKATAKVIKAEQPDFVIGVGDLSYSSQEAAWCDHWKSTVQYKNILVLSGNHDSGESSGGNINKYIKACPNPLAGVAITGDYGKRFYFDYPAANPLARFIMITPGLGGSHIGLDTKYDQGREGFKFTAGAIDDARTRGIKWIFVGMHKNYISTMEKDNEISTDNGRTFMTMLLNKKVDIILQGHEHGYERTKQLTTNAATCSVLPTNTFDSDCVVDSDNDMVKGAGTIIHVIGTGGRSLRDLWTSDPEFQYFAKADTTTYGFGKFAVTADSLTFSFHRSAGGTFSDSFTIR